MEVLSLEIFLWAYFFILEYTGIYKVSLSNGRAYVQKRKSYEGHGCFSTCF